MTCGAALDLSQSWLCLDLQGYRGFSQILATEDARREGTQAKGQKPSQFLEGAKVVVAGVLGMSLLWVPTLSLVRCSPFLIWSLSTLYPVALALPSWNF